MKKKQRIKTVKIDANIDETLKKFERTMGRNEEIIATEVVGDKLVIVVESTNSKNENLLLG